MYYEWHYESDIKKTQGRGCLIMEETTLIIEWWLSLYGQLTSDRSNNKDCEIKFRQPQAEKS